MVQQTELCEMYLQKLAPLGDTSFKDDLLRRYGETKYVKDDKAISVLLEFDGGKASFGIYWGIKCGKNVHLSDDEIIQIISYLQSNGCHRSVFPNDSTTNIHWRLWFQLGYNEPIEKALEELNLLKQAVELVGFEKR